jgi:hypothetical protein
LRSPEVALFRGGCGRNGGRARNKLTDMQVASLIKFGDYSMAGEFPSGRLRAFLLGFKNIPICIRAACSAAPWPWHIAMPSDLNQPATPRPSTEVF